MNLNRAVVFLRSHFELLDEAEILETLEKRLRILLILWIFSNL